MGRKIFDITPELSTKTDVWAGDQRFEARRTLSKPGASVNLTTITTTVQIGAHIDAPLHYLQRGKDASKLDLERFVGHCRVVRVRTQREVTKRALERHSLQGVQRLLIHTRDEADTQARFEDPFASLAPAAAEYIGELGVKVLGIDSFSVDKRTSKDLPSHNALHRAGCAILEGIVLSAVPEGDYELIALPLPLVACDASPVRAILRSLD